MVRRILPREILKLCRVDSETSIRLVTNSTSSPFGMFAIKLEKLIVGRSVLSVRRSTRAGEVTTVSFLFFKESEI